MSKTREPQFLTGPVQPVAPPRGLVLPPQRPPCEPAIPMEVGAPPGTGTPGPLFGVAVSDADRFIAVAHDNGLVGLWQPALAAITGLTTPLIVGRGHTRSVRAVAFEPPGFRDYACLVTGSVDSTIRTWHVGDRARNAVLHPHDSSVMCLAFDAAGARLVSGSEDRTIAITSWPDGKLERRFAAHDGTVLGVAVSPNGKQIASGGFDGCVYLWSITGKRLARIAHDSGEWVWNIYFVDDQRIVFSKGPRVVVWTARTGCQTLYTLGDPIYSVQALAVRGDGDEIAFGDAHDVVTLSRDGQVRRRSGHAGVVHGVAYLGDGRVASTANDGALLVWGDDDDPELQLRAESA